METREIVKLQRIRYSCKTKKNAPNDVTIIRALYLT